MVERSNGKTETVEIFNYTNNLANSLALQPFYMASGEKVTVKMNIQCINGKPGIFYREPQNNIDIEGREAFYIDYYMIYAPPADYKSPVNTPSMDGVIEGYRLLTEVGTFGSLTIVCIHYILPLNRDNTKI